MSCQLSRRVMPVESSMSHQVVPVSPSVVPVTLSAILEFNSAFVILFITIKK